MKRFINRSIIGGGMSAVGLTALASVLGAGVKWGFVSEVVDFMICGVKWLG
jgi:hypothetical protein